MLLPLAWIVLFLFLYRAPSNRGTASHPPVEKPKSAWVAPGADGRLIVLIIDSLRRQAIDELMPNLKAFSQQPAAVDLDVQTASANMSLSCIQTLLEGRESPYASAIHDFTGERSANNSLPRAAAQAGLKQAIIGDFIVTGLYGPDANVVIGENSLPQRNPERDLTCDVCAIDKAIDVLSDKSIRVLILHLPGTDHVAHKYKPHHPEYDRHYRQVDRKLAEFFRVLDLNKDYLIVTGDHGHNDLGNHVPQSVAIFAGGLYPQLFATIGPIKQLHQVDMLFFMAFAQNLPLSLDYEGSYFGLDRSPDLPDAMPSLRDRVTAFINLQKETLSAAGFQASDLTGAVAEQRSEEEKLPLNKFHLLLPLIVLYFAWIVIAFHINDRPEAPIWPLAALTFAAPLLWFFARPEIGIALSIVIAFGLFIAAVQWRDFNRIGFLSLLALASVFTAYQAENWATIFRYPVPTLIGIGAVLVLIRGGNIRTLPAAICAFSLLGLPSGAYRVESGFYIIRGFTIGCGVLLLWLVARRAWPKFTPAEWIPLLALPLSLAALLCQTASGGFVHNTLFDWLVRSRLGPVATVLLYLACFTYLISAVGGSRMQVMTIGFAVILALYCSWFARLSFALLSVTLIVPVFIASWTIWEKAAPPLRRRDDLTDEGNGLILFMALVLALWVLLQGFFVQQIDFSFGMKFLSVATPENREFAVLYPFTLLKYGLPLALIVFVFIALRGVLSARRAVCAALLFCNFKLATLVLQSLVGPLHSHQKLYEFAMSDFVFVSQIMVILAISYLIAVFGASILPVPSEFKAVADRGSNPIVA